MIEVLGCSLLGLVAVAAFLLPGWLISRWARAPWPGLTSFLASAVLWFHLVLFADVAEIPFRRGSMLGLWFGISMVLGWLARRQPPARRRSTWLRPRGSEWLWIGAAACALMSIALRSLLDPLSGWDNTFRWDHLARSLVAHGHLHFYPPVRAQDFEHYAWVDGIPPLASLLNAWLYLFTGTSAPQIIAARVIGEAALVAAAVHTLARTLWGDRAGWPAVGIAATSALLLWGVAQAQEVGLLAIAIVTMLACLMRWKTESSPRLAAWAGVAAAIGALNREYGLALLLLGAGFLVFARAKPRSWAAFLVPAVGLCAWWYVRNVVRTGNPLYPQTLGGWFPGNVFFNELLACIGDYWQLGGPHIQPRLLAGSLLVLGVGPAVAALCAARRCGRTVLLPLTAIAVFVALWAASVRMTAGGVNYSLRVLTPAVAVLAALGGATGLFSRRAQIITAMLALLFSVDAARRSWLLPVTPLASPWPYTWAPWAAVRDAIVAERSDRLWPQLVQRSRGEVIGVDSPSAHAAIAANRGRAMMLFSPVFRFCFAGELSPADVVAQLRHSNVRLLLLHVDDPVIRRLITRQSFFRQLVRQQAPALEGPGYAVYDLNTLTLQSETP